jgi:hypothetical protein
MRLVYLNGALMTRVADYRWERDRLLFKFRLREDDKISVVDLTRHRRTDYGFEHTKKIEMVLDPAQKWEGVTDDGMG